ncbi:MAG: hypothetical protein U9N84_14695 [Actinomycetota bacterium]|nr:hypothetical protein [Actinomycetota bacterium]
MTSPDAQNLSKIWNGFESSPLTVGECRAHGRFQFQKERQRAAYLRSAELLSGSAKRLLTIFEEDGNYGAVSHLTSDGELLTRDLLDSTAEIGFLLDRIGDLALDSVIDIGSGYGRMAHRINALRPDSVVICADEVPSSRSICSTYLTLRGVAGFLVCDFDAAGELTRQHRPILATAVHSFPEMPLKRIRAWLELLTAGGVDWLFLVPNEPDRLRSTEPDGTRSQFADAIDDAGYHLAATGWKYEFGEKDAYSTNLVYQDQYLLYRRSA